MKYALAQSLLAELEQFEKEMGSRSLRDFAHWLFGKYGEGEGDLPPNEDQPFLQNRHEELAYSIVILNQHARHYIRKALEGTDLHGISDFTFLAAVLDFGDMSKSRLIDLNFLEFSSGMEVIRRLIRKGLLSDYRDPNDRRSRKVRITKAGRQEFSRAIGEMEKASRIIGGNLGEGEAAKALSGIRKLLRFHERIWREDQEKKLDEIVNKYPELRS